MGIVAFSLMICFLWSLGSGTFGQVCIKSALAVRLFVLLFFARARSLLAARIFFTKENSAPLLRQRIAPI